MKRLSFLIDTNIIIALEDNQEVEEVYADFYRRAKSHAKIFVHEASKADFLRDKDTVRGKISKSKLEKYPILSAMQGLEKETLLTMFGTLNRTNDEVDCKLLHTLHHGAVDFLVTNDSGINKRAGKHSSALGKRVLFIWDAVQFLTKTYQLKDVLIDRVEEVKANEIDIKAPIFNSLRDGYKMFDNWWHNKCVKQHRDCWVIYVNNDIAGLVVRKDESNHETDATKSAKKIMKICTFKVAEEYRGANLGELLLKKVMWFAQLNQYDLAYLTTFPNQFDLIYLLECYGFNKSDQKKNNELIFEKSFAQSKLELDPEIPHFELTRINYPRFVVDRNKRSFIIPIKEEYHNILFPDVQAPREPDMFDEHYGNPTVPASPGNAIHKVYLCRANVNLDDSGCILLFYKSKSKKMPSQSLTAVGIFESVDMAESLQDLIRLTGRRSVYSKEKLEQWKATEKNPVRVINFLLITYIEPVISLDKIKEIGIFESHPPQSIQTVSHDSILKLMNEINLGFKV